MKGKEGLKIINGTGHVRAESALNIRTIMRINACAKISQIICARDFASCQPEIWRRFVVPANITLDRLHDVIQIVMGWKDYHLYQFTIGKKRYTENPELKGDGLECGKYRLVDLIKQKGRTFNYLYDFGDSWEHLIILECLFR